MAASLPLPLSQLLPEVSRSFYLTLRVLPAAIRPQIGLAYLLARTTDTIADTNMVPLEQRQEALGQLQARIAGTRNLPLSFLTWPAQSQTTSDRRLLECTESTLAVLTSFSSNDQELIRTVLATITTGQMLDLRRFHRASITHIVALNTEAELDDYTFRVAGCVGEFWTRICRAHLFPQAAIDESWLIAQGVRFGQGLQLVNILRDLPMDLRQGRCYLPSERLQAIQVLPEHLLMPATEAHFRPLYQAYLAKAHGHLAAGWDYTNALPYKCVRVRLACAWPILIGIRTLHRLQHQPVLDPQRRVKVTRAEVYQIMLQTLLRYPWPPAWRHLFPKNR